MKSACVGVLSIIVVTTMFNIPKHDAIQSGVYVQSFNVPWRCRQGVILKLPKVSIKLEAVSNMYMYVIGRYAHYAI